MKLKSSDIAAIAGGVLIGPPDIVVSELVTDSRQLSYTDEIAFVAIRGKNHDGHKYIAGLYQKGIRTFIVENLPENIPVYPEAAFILSESTVAALQLIASARRKAFTSPVIAITGSAGKTIVKEWLADIMSLSLPVIRSPRSYNSQIGVPLSVWKLDEKYRLGIFEAGISHPGEMEKLQRIINPSIGVITNIGDAHRENFPDYVTKAAEKLKLFRDSSTIIYCLDHKIVSELIDSDENLKRKELISWSLQNKNATVFAEKVNLASGNTGINLTYKGRVYYFEVPFQDRASVENALSVTAVCLHLGVSQDLIDRGLRGLVSVPMRMEMKGGINNCQLIEDYYNSDPGSLGMALEYLKAQNGRKTTLILSDFVQAGRSDPELYGEVAGLLKKTAITRFIGIGRSLASCKHLFRPEDRFYYSTDEFIRSIITNEFSNEIILLKGARVFEFEKIARVLEQQVHLTVLEINLDAISHNLNKFRSYLYPSTKIMAMVKAFAYGSGSSEIASFLEYHRVSYLAVAYADEGVGLRNSGVTLPVMVMNPDPSAAELMIKYSLEPELYSITSFQSFVSVADRHGLIGYPVHIKIDTGMHRLGFLPEEIAGLVAEIRKRECIRIISVFSHLAASENAGLDNFTKKQVETFLSVAGQIRQATTYPFMRHILNSSGIVRMPAYQFEMVRPGIGIYGAGSFDGIDLRPAGRFKTRISQVKRVKGGEPVGYGCTDVSDTDRIIAILPVGYADGLKRKMGNRRGNLFIQGKRVPIIGNVCMDMCMADITGVDAQAGDEAEIFGENISINEIAEICETIPYEILTSIPERVKRVFFRG
ncbi:MAG: bifunctional UDP-N-acetylmuramoyl-tripeptide:D-alanyl-D-alanine ligase/alanine racemase [Bacteroidetes bacterium]|nr:bifunctional UDP-N-acetylmuramoyl-tripeptide:D-alanyl-D-alanine ligase/alanine racemase [Bacteroidota bacterium]